MKLTIATLSLATGLLIGQAVFAEAPASAPAGSTGLCKDGTYYSGASKQGACSGHKGVKEWYGEAATTAPAKKAPASTAAAPAAAVSAGARPAGASGLCKDGTYYSGASKQGACSGHKGVKEWYGESAATAAPTKAAAASSAAAPAAAASSGARPAGATGLCKDGTYYSGASKQGACSGHKGVQEWYGGAAAAAAPATVAPPPAEAPARTSSPAPTTAAAAGGGPGLVWVNTSSKVYHCSGDQWYGKTKEGAYMSESEAVAKGNRPDHGKACSSR